MRKAIEVLDEYTEKTAAWHKEDITKAMVVYVKEVLQEIERKHMPEDQRYHSSGTVWCRVCMEDIAETIYKIE